MKKRIMQLVLVMLCVNSISILSFASGKSAIGEPAQREEEIYAGGYVIEGLETANKEDEVLRMGSGTEDIAYQLGDNITATLSKDGVLTLSGQGEMKAVSSAMEVPWYANRFQVKKVVIEEGITSISTQIFSVCYYLQEVELPDTLTDIGSGAFCDCQYLKSIIIPDSVKIIEDGAFANCISLESITFGTGLEKVGEYAFQQTALKELDFPDTVSTIGNGIALKSKIERIRIPASATAVGYVGYGAEYLKEIQVAEGNANYVSVDNVLFSADKTMLISYAPAKENEEYNIPDTVVSIADYAFSYAANLKNVTMGNTITTMGEWVFFHSGLVSAVIPDSVTTIGPGTFEECSNLVSAVLGAGITTTPYRCFMNCKNLESVTFKDGLKQVDTRCFYDCPKITSVTFPSTVTRIEDFSIMYCSNLQQVVIPEGVQYIGGDAFYKCPKVTFNIPTGLVKLESGCYMKVVQLTISGAYDYKNAFEVLDIVNAERAAVGLAPLVMDEELLNAAMLRAAETCIDFDHTRPSGESCFDISEKIYGENIAAGPGSASGAMNLWMNSSGHRANILGESYTSIGVGCFVQDGETFWVQVFGLESSPSVSQPENADVTVKINVAYDREFKLCFPDETFVTYEDTTEEARPGLVNNGWDATYALLDGVNFNWSIDKTKYATVDENGIVTGIKKGKGNLSFSLKEKPEIGMTVPFKILKNTDKKGNTIYIEEEDGECFVYNKAQYRITSVKKKTLVCIGSSKKSNKTISIPSTIKIEGNKYKITEISANAFKNNKKITTFTIGKNVSKIGKNAFYGCKKLKKLTIKSTKLKNNNVGASAFKKTYNKMEVKVPASKYKIYKKVLQKKGLSKKAKITK